MRTLQWWHETPRLCLQIFSELINFHWMLTRTRNIFFVPQVIGDFPLNLLSPAIIKKFPSLQNLVQKRREREKEKLSDRIICLISILLWIHIYEHFHTFLSFCWELVENIDYYVYVCLPATIFSSTASAAAAATRGICREMRVRFSICFHYGSYPTYIQLTILCFILPDVVAPMSFIMISMLEHK